MKVLEKDDEFYSFIGQSKPTIVEFATHDCATCIPIEKKIDEKFENIEKVKVYLDDMPTLRGALGIFNVPVVCVYFESKEFAKFIRVFSMDELQAKIDRLLEFI